MLRDRSDTGNGWDNAVAASFLARLENELVHLDDKTPAEVGHEYAETAWTRVNETGGTPVAGVEGRGGRGG